MQRHEGILSDVAKLVNMHKTWCWVNEVREYKEEDSANETKKQDWNRTHQFQLGARQGCIRCAFLIKCFAYIQILKETNQGITPWRRNLERYKHAYEMEALWENKFKPQFVILESALDFVLLSQSHLADRALVPGLTRYRSGKRDTRRMPSALTRRQWNSTAWRTAFREATWSWTDPLWIDSPSTTPLTKMKRRLPKHVQDLAAVPPEPSFLDSKGTSVPKKTPLQSTM